jgi:4-aminobutyrate aminotransferase-like enzyme
VRGKGLMLGIELVREKKEPAVAEILQLFENTKKRGLLIGKGGLYGNVVRITPLR